MADVDSLVSQIFPYIKDAVGAYGKAVLTKAEDTAAGETVLRGQRFLAALLGRRTARPGIKGAVERLAEEPDAPGSEEALRDQIKRALREDPELAREVQGLQIRLSSATVSGDGSVGVGGDHQGPIQTGGTTTNVNNTVNNNVVRDQRISGLSVAALVLGLFGFLILPIPVAIVLGLIALVRVLRPSRAAEATGADRAGNQVAGGGRPEATAGAPQNAPYQKSAPDPRTDRTAEPAASDTSSGWTDASPDTSPTAGTPGPPGPDPGGASAPPPPAPGPDGAYVPPPGPEAGAFAPPAATPSAAAPSAAAPAAATGFSAPKVITIVFAVFGICASGMWGLGWTVAAAIVVQAESAPTASGPDGAVGAAPAPEELCEPSAGYATVCTLEVGDCFIEPAATEFYEVELAGCTETHDAEVIGAYSPGTGEWPGAASFDADIDDTCAPMSDRKLDPARAPATYFVGYIAPNEAAWDYGITDAFCYVAADGESLTTSVLAPGAS